MSEAPVLVELERHDDGVAVIRLNNPKVNAISSEVLRQLHSVVKTLEADLPRAVVVTGSDRFFAAGADITEFTGPEAAQAMGPLFLEGLNALAALNRPTIASISGFALGGGLELALSCDLRIASSKAKVGLPEILLGIIPGGGGTQRLARLIGPSRAKDLIFSGRQVGAEEALSIGLVERVVEPEELWDKTLEWARELGAGASAAMGFAKRAIDAGLETTLAEGLKLEQEQFVDVFRTNDAKVGVASFLENGPGKATFSGS
ncbi:MAG: enoyl-CoA hydratase/isomerase family protein [Acidimicrobiales bacterium]|nr:enoyl-CoA hydratase/isomerase family protein [Acidimicrobiales bacterium]